MAIIEADGLFHGDRMKKCSMLAQLFWPRFYLAANGYARLELNYSKLLDGPLASLPSPPSEADVWQMFKEYFINHLGFLYRCDGQVWCQFATEERHLTRHKTKSDKRSPEPPAEEYGKWLNEYRQTKNTTQVIDLTGLAIIPESFRKSSEKFPNDSEKYVRGVGSGVGSGVGDGKGEGKKHSAKSADDKTSDPRHSPVREHIKRSIEHATNLKPAPWDGRDAKALERVLSANPSWNQDVFIELIKNRFRSEDVPRGDPAHKWLFDLAKYADGPLDRFGKVRSGNGQPSKAEQRTANNLRANEDAKRIIQTAMDRRRIDKTSGSEGSGSERAEVCVER